MPRRKTKHEKIPSESVRRSTLTKRLENIFRKSDELSILCDAKVAVVINNQREGKLTMWPSENEATVVVKKFLRFPNEERLKKMVDQENYLEVLVDKMNEKVLKLTQKNEETEMRCLVMSELMKGTKSFDELDMEQLSRFSQFAGRKLKEIEKRMNELDEAEGELSHGSVDQTQVKTLMDDLPKGTAVVEPKPDEISSDLNQDEIPSYV